MQKIIAVIFLLFAICFVAIIVEECFLGGRRRRRLERKRRQESEETAIRHIGKEGDHASDANH